MKVGIYRSLKGNNWEPDYKHNSSWSSKISTGTAAGETGKIIPACPVVYFIVLLISGMVLTVARQ